MMRKCLYMLLSCWLLAAVSALGQHDPYHIRGKAVPGKVLRIDPYAVSLENDWPYLAGAALFSAAGKYLSFTAEPMTAAEISALNPNDVNGFDRFATNNWSVRAARVSDAAMGLSLAAPVVSLFALRRTRRDYLRLALMGAEALLLNDALTFVVKTQTGRVRPFIYNPDAPMAQKVRRNGRSSFFSGHASYAAVGSFFAAKVLHDYFPGSKARPWFWVSATALTGLTATMRVAAGKHFPTDVIVGSAVGAAVGVLIPEFHRKKSSRFTVVPLIGSSQGLILTTRF